MIRATQVLPAGSWDLGKEADAVELPHDGRHRRRIVMRGVKDTAFLLDLPEATRLCDGDGLALVDGRIVRVVAAAEPVAEIFGDAHLLARIAWHLGNRHALAQIMPDRIRIARDHVLEQMLERLGARISHLVAPFDPEPGAYAHESHSASAHAVLRSSPDLGRSQSHHHHPQANAHEYQRHDHPHSCDGGPAEETDFSQRQCDEH